MLKITNTDIGLMTDIDMVRFIQNGLRGGVSYINTRYQESNDTTDILYIDANNLYGHAQKMKLPKSSYEWLKLPTSMSATEMFDYCVKYREEFGSILEVDLIYPESLHEKHSNFPLAPEKMLVTFEDLSPYCQEGIRNTTKNIKYKSEKLCSTFRPRKKYAIHIDNLIAYLNWGLILIKVHRILIFGEADFLKPYIDLCTEKRIQSKNDFEKNLYKNLANSCYGKFLQDERKYVKVRINYNSWRLNKSIQCPSFQKFIIINENVTLTVHKQLKIKHWHPYAVGFTILEYSKLHMYKSFYDDLLSDIPYQNVNLLATDTDSFILSIKNFDWNQLKKLKMDFSNYPKTHELYNECYKNMTGIFKDEFASKKATTFCGLRSKCYALKFENSEKKICKGLGRTAIKKTLTFDDYFKCLFEQKEMRFGFRSIQSKKQEIRTIFQNKKALSFIDTKRWIFNCGIHSTPFGSNVKICTICKI